MKVVFDSNVLISDRWLSGADFRELASSRRETGHEIVVPLLAVDEAVNDYREHLASAERDLARATESLTRLLHKPFEPPAVDRERLLREYRTELLERLRQAGARVSTYPRVPHERIVRRALDRRRPFDDRGHDGYRDVLMWHSVLSELQTSGDVAFVSSDSGFYDLTQVNRRVEPRPAGEAGAPVPASEPRRPSTLHPHLEPDLLGRVGVPRLFLTLRDFVAREVHPRLALARASVDPLEAGSPYPGFDPRRAVLDHLLPGFRFFALDPAMLGMPPEVEYASVVSVEDVVRAEVRSARRAGTEVIAELMTECEVRVETYAWQEAPAPEDVGHSGLSEEDLLDEERPLALLRVELSIVIDPRARSVTAVEILNVAPIH